MIHLLKGIGKWPLVCQWTYHQDGVEILTKVKGVVFHKHILFAELRLLLEVQGNAFGEWVSVGLDSKNNFVADTMRDQSGIKHMGSRDPCSVGGTHFLSAWSYGDRLEVLCSGASENSFIDFPPDSDFVVEPERTTDHGAETETFEGREIFRKFCPAVPEIQTARSGSSLSISVFPCYQDIYLLVNDVEVVAKCNVDMAHVVVKDAVFPVVVRHRTGFLDPITVER